MKLHGYQEDAKRAIIERQRVIIVSDMGSGKTLLTLTAIQELGCKVWIFAPLRIASTVWSDEIEKFDLPLTISRVVGTPAQRRKALAVDADVYITNFENVPWLYDEIGELDDDVMVVIDESSRVKNPKGRRLKILHKLIKSTKRRIGLTGTPAPQGPLDLFSQVNTIIGPVWGKSFYAWRAQYFHAVDRDGFIWKPFPGSVETITQQFAALAHKVDYNLEIPATHLIDKVTLPPAAMRQYREMEKEAIIELQELGAVAAFDPLSQLMKCRQLAGGTIYDEVGDWEVLHRTKLDAVKDIALDSGENLLIAYQFRSELALLKEQWPDAPILGGGTSANEGAEIMARWNRGEVPILLGHPASFGHGLNLQKGGRRLVWYSLPWSLEEYLQANARLARQGQTEHVYIHHLIAADTVDTKVMKALGGKTNVQESIINALTS